MTDHPYYVVLDGEKINVRGPDWAEPHSRPKMKIVQGVYVVTLHTIEGDCVLLFHSREMAGRFNYDRWQRISMEYPQNLILEAGVEQVMRWATSTTEAPALWVSSIAT